MGYWKNKLPSFIYNPVNNWLRNRRGTPKLTYSGEGEDLILLKIFNGKTNGFFVDIGCYHPVVGSNTHIFSKKYDWKGINIDANPDSLERFRQMRTNDININVGVGRTAGNLNFHRFSEGALNTFSDKIRDERISRDNQTYLGSIPVPITRLDLLFEQHLAEKQIDFLDVDVEGLDLEVLQSNDWKRFRPFVVLVEEQSKVADSFESLPSYRFLREQGYVLIAKTYSTLIFAETQFANDLYY